MLAELLGRDGAVLDPDRAEEIALLARTARPQLFGPMERIIVQGQEGDSLFAVVDGTVEVAAAARGRRRRQTSARAHGTVLGEMSLLTGEPRSATVRAVDGALVYEVGRRQLQPLLAARPELFEALQGAMVARLETQQSLLERYDAARCGSAFRRRFCEERQRVDARGVRAEALDVVAHRRRAGPPAAAARRRTRAGRPPRRRGRRR